MRRKVKWHEISYRSEIIKLLNELQKEYRNLTSLLFLGEPLKMSANHLVLVCSGPFSTTVKISGPGKVIYTVRYILQKIKDGTLDPEDKDMIKLVIDQYKI